MLIIKNSTGTVLEVFNKSFSKEIPIGEEISVSYEEINGDYDISFKYFGLNEEKSHLKSEWKTRSFGRRRLVYNREKEYDIPVLTVVNVNDCENIEVECDNVDSTTILPFMISQSIKKVKFKANGKRLACKRVDFLEKKNKTKFLIHSIIGFVLKLLTLFILIGTSVMGWIESNWTWEDVLLPVILSALSFMLAFLWISDTRALIRACGFKTPAESEEFE